MGMNLGDTPLGKAHRQFDGLSRIGLGKITDPLGLFNKPPEDPSIAAARREAERQAQITQTISNIDAIYDGDARKGQISQYGADLLNKLTSDINEKKVVADRDLKFALARSGQTGGSVAIDQNRQLGNDYQKSILEAARRSQAGMADLRGKDASSRLNLIAMAQQGLSTGSAAAQAAASMASALDSSRNSNQYDMLGDLFTGVASAKKYSEEGAARRRADRNYASLYPGATALNTGGFN